MRSDKLIKLLLALTMLSTLACTTRKDGFVYRVFHNTTARYNGYFYAKEAMRESKMTLKEKQEDDYDEILPVFIYGTEENAQEIFPLMERVVEKSSRVIERHNMDPPSRRLKKQRDRPEMNKWIDDNYLLIGKAYFYKQNYYKAEEMFLFVSRKYKEKEMQALSNAWLTRCYLEVEDYVRAKNVVRKAVQVNNLEEEVKSEVLLVYADYFIQIGEYKDAAEQLEKALRLIKKKKDKARPTFILAQLMQAQGKAQDAIAYFNGVLKLRPDYEMEFYAKIMQAMAFDRRGGNSAEIKETLFDMLKDDKNAEYRDQIYYALAKLELEEQNRNQGIDYLETSLAVNEGNQKQKMKSFLSLADLYLEDKAYQLAQAYYDSTFRNIEEDHERYEDVKNKAESLTELVTYLNVIDEQDSLAMLCELGDEELVAKLEDIRQQQIDELEAAMLAAQQALAAGSDDGGTVGGAGAFWPYNPALRQTGKSNFSAYWGMRELEDDWRRSSKVNAAFSQGEEEQMQEQVQEEVAEEVSIEDQVPTVDEMLAQLPCSDQAQGESKIAIADAYYNSGVIYREKLEDLDNAIEQWEVLVTRFDESEYHPTAFYLLYRTYLFKESQGYQNPFCGTCNSRHWGDMILERYPGTEWAMLVENPEYQDYAELKRAEERRAYEQVLDKYYKRQYQNVILETGEVIANEPENHMLCKYKLLKAQAIGGMDGRVGMRDNYIKELELIVAECPDTEEAAFASEKLKKLREEKKEEEEVEEEEVVEEYPFDFNEGSRHYFMLVLPMGEGNVNEIKAQLSDFSSKYFKSDGLKVSSNLIDRDHQVVLVKTFNRIGDGTAFFGTFQSSEDTKDLRDAGYAVSLISKENYVTLFKNKNLEAYQGFFLQNYEL